MAGEGSKVGEVYVEIKATGAENVAREVQKAQAMATAPGILNASAKTAGGGGAYDLATGAYDLHPSFVENPAADVAAWAAVTQETNKAAVGAAKFGEAAAAATGRASQGLRQAKAAVSSIAGSAGFGPIPGIIARISALLGPVGLAITTMTGGVAIFASSWLKVRDNARRATEEMDRIVISYEKFIDKLLRPPGDRFAMVKTIEDEAEASRERIYDEYKKNTESVFSFKDRAYKEYWAKRAKIDSREFTALYELEKKFADDTKKENETATKRSEEKRADDVERSVERTTAYEKALNQEVADMKLRAATEGLDPVDAIRTEGKAAIEAVRERLTGTKGLEKEMLDALLQSTIEYYGKKETVAIESADKIKQNEIKQARDAANQTARVIGEAYSKATADIMANFANQQSQSIEELAQYVKLIAEGVGR